MRVDSSNIGMESARRYSSVKSQSMKFSLSRQRGTLAGLGENGLGNLLLSSDQEGKKEEAGIEEENAQNRLWDFRNRLSGANAVNRIPVRDEKDAWQKIKQNCMLWLFEMLFSRKKPRSITDETGGIGTTSGSIFQNVNVTTLSFDVEALFCEQESTSFSTEGTVRTADGREIAFNLELEMSRSFSAYYHENYEMQSVSMCDPLVINLDSDIASVSDQKFYFDLDADGTKESISTLNAGSGYLALDLNGDGVINDGSELFGAKSGDGFADLKKYDSDGNGWIDEGDEIWDKLLIWMKDENGQDRLYHVAQKGVGAICLQNAQTDFSLNSTEDNHVNGQIRKTGIFLYENGNVGTIQHVDLAT